MRVIALLALIFGSMTQMLLDGQVFNHAVIGIVCGVAAVGCGLASSRKDRRHRWEGWMMAGLGMAIGVRCIVILPTTYQQQEKFNDRTRKYRERIERQKKTPNQRAPAPPWAHSVPPFRFYNADLALRSIVISAGQSLTVERA